MKRAGIYILFFFFSFKGFSQNLVVNPSFENFNTCPLGPGSFDVQNWVQPYPIAGGCSTSDYYNACNTNGFADVPSNFLGIENALTGVGYVGVMLYETMTPNPCGPPKGNDYREYIEGTLSSPLVAGQTYSVSFNVSLPDDVMFASDDIGIYFSNTLLNLSCPPPFTSTVLANTPQLQYTGAPVTNANGWTLLQWSYTAAGGEQYITIGNFKNDANTDGVCTNPAASSLFAYYYIDDVNVSLATPPSGLNTTTSVNNILCNNQCTGTATATPSNGTTPYTYLWSPGGQTTSSATGLCAGAYSVLVTDAANATVSSTVTISQPTAMAATTTMTATSCSANTGTANVTASGGNPGFTYSWSNGQTTSAISGLAAGNYSLTVLDANGCSVISSVVVTSANGPSVTASFTNASCNGINNGTAMATASGGTSPFSYTWSNGQTTSTISGLSSGTYSVLVTDGNGCTNASVVNIGNGSGPVVFVSSNVSISAGDSASLNASGGTTYSWYPSSGLNCTSCSNPMASPSAATQYCVMVTDINGCSDSACVMVFIIPEPVPCGEFYVPNAFSPNEDLENDDFRTYINPLCVTEFKLVIYNRWGEIVFETEDVTKGWNGYFRDALSDPAVYAYSCTIYFTNGTTIEKRGNVSLIR